jgi:hypothetical protein
MIRNANMRAYAMVFIAALTAIAAPHTRAEDRIRAGLWETTTTQGGKQVNSGTRCITPELAASSNENQAATREMLQASWAKANCTLKELAVTASTISFAVDCDTGADARTISSVSKYHGDTFETELISKRSGSASDMITKGRRLGACP